MNRVVRIVLLLVGLAFYVNLSVWLFLWAAFADYADAKSSTASAVGYTPIVTVVLVAGLVLLGWRGGRWAFRASGND